MQAVHMLTQQNWAHFASTMENKNNTTFRLEEKTKTKQETGNNNLLKT